MCMRRQIDAIFLLRSFSIMDLRQGLSVDLQLIEYARLDGQGSLYPVFSVLGSLVSTQHFIWVLGTQIQVLMLTQQALPLDFSL